MTGDPKGKDRRIVAFPIIEKALEQRRLTPVAKRLPWWKRFWDRVKGLFQSRKDE